MAEERVTPVTAAPVSDLDLFEDALLRNPYPAYESLRNAGAAVWMSRLGMYVLTRYADVRHALENWQIFTSAQGVTMNSAMNEALRGGLLCSDPPSHDAIRKVLSRPLAPAELNKLRNRIETEAEALAERLVAKRRFDAATELAQHLPVTIVSELVGLPEKGRERMLEWAAANFDCFGPMNGRTVQALEIVKEMIRYAFTEAVPGKLRPGGWAAMVYEAADRGELQLEQCPFMMNDYMGPALDTTIFATSTAVWLFACFPEQWEALRRTPGMVPNAINEVLRLESPIQNFSRVLTADYVFDGITMPAGSRTIISYGAANRDPRKWQDADRFDVLRSASDHLGFGRGVHQCIGSSLARMEISAVLNALLKRVSRFEIVDAERQLNNVLRGFKRLEVVVH